MCWGTREGSETGRLRAVACCVLPHLRGLQYIYIYLYVYMYICVYLHNNAPTYLPTYLACPGTNLQLVAACEISSLQHPPPFQPPTHSQHCTHVQVQQLDNSPLASHLRHPYPAPYAICIFPHPNSPHAHNAQSLSPGRRQTGNNAVASPCSRTVCFQVDSKRLGASAPAGNKRFQKLARKSNPSCYLCCCHVG